MAIGERLYMARKISNLSQRDLARAAGVSAMAISKYERDLDMPGSNVLIRLARALDVKVEFFLRPVTVSLTAPAYRCRKKLGAKQKASIEARVREWLERYLQVERLFDDLPPFAIPPINGHIRTIENAEGVADQLRCLWQVGTDPLDNLVELFESRGIKVGQMDAPNDFDALTFWVNGETPVMVVKKDLPGDRQRFNLAHELGHLLLEPAGDVDEEKAAHRFAAAFLVPAQSARRELGSHRSHIDPRELYLLKHKYGLSMTAWIKRATDLHIISESVSRRVWMLFSKQGWRKQEPGEPVPCEKTARMKQLVLRALAENAISRSRAAELLGEPLDIFLGGQAEKLDRVPTALGS